MVRDSTINALAMQLGMCFIGIFAGYPLARKSTPVENHVLQF
jgi:hypothetical protein